MKKIILFIIGLILLSSFSSALIYQDKFIFNDSLSENGLNMATVGSISFETAKFGKALIIDGITEGLCHTNNTLFNVEYQENLSICWAFQVNQSETYNRFLFGKFGLAPNQARISAHIVQSNDGVYPNYLGVTLKSSSVDVVEIFSNNPITFNVPHTACLVYNDSNKRLNMWFDAVKQSATQTDSGMKNITTNAVFAMGAWKVGGTTCASLDTGMNDGYIDDLLISKNILSQIQIEEYNNTVNITTILNPILTLSSNLTSNNVYNYSVYEPNFEYSFNFNASLIKYTTNLFNCSIYFNDTLNKSFYGIDLTNNINYNFSIVNWEKIINITINCSNSNSSDSLIETNLSFDTILPKIEISISLQNNSNHTDTERQVDNLDFEVVIFDNNLYAYNRTIKDLTGINETNFFIENITSTSYQDNVSFNLDYGEAKQFSLQIHGWDSHTNKKLKKIEIILDNKLYFSGITFQCENIKSMEIIKEKDKLRPKVKFKNSSGGNCYYIGKDFKSVYNSKYPNHFIDLKNKVWIDETNYKIEQINKNTLRLKVNKKEFISDSLGELNYIEKTYFFSIVYVSLTAEQNIILESINNTLKNLTGGIEMIGIMILIVVTLLIGVLWIRWILSLSGLFMIWLSLLIGSQFITNEIVSKQWYYKGGMYGLFFIGIGFLLIGLATTFLQYFGAKKTKEEETFNYPEY